MVEIDLHQVPLTSLSDHARHHLSCLLNTAKVLLSDGPEKLPRYWKGLACLLGISTEEALSYEQNQTEKVLDYWIGKNDGTATVGYLLEYLQRIDRYDVFDDFLEFASNGTLISNANQRVQNNQVAVCLPYNQLVLKANTSEDGIAGSLITFDDIIRGSPQIYDAYVLFADEDREFVNYLLVTMRKKNLKLCTEEDLLPGFSTTFEPVAQLISSDRINKIILIYSPAFLKSPANNFYMNYAQAVGIEKRRPKIVPVMLHDCVLPAQMMFYHKLYVQHKGSKPSYDFYERLAISLRVSNNHVNESTSSCSSSLSAMNITEVPISSDQGHSTSDVNGLVALPSSASVNESQNINGTSKINGVNGVMVNGNAAHDRSLSSGKFKRKKAKHSKNPLKMFWTSIVQMTSTKN